MHKLRLTFAWIGMGACLWLMAATPAAAEDPLPQPERTQNGNESWYNYDKPTEYQPNPTAIIQQKAMIRAAKRQARMASMQWYGMSNSRPTAAAMPWSTMYSPAWQMPGGRPFAWYTSGRPVYVLNR
jgi:hypothetical protein